MLGRVIIHTLASVQFLSRIPVKPADSDDGPDFKTIAYAFPLAGLLIALPCALVIWVFHSTGLPEGVVALLAIITMVMTTGALHEDGLADVADGFWGGHTKKHKLEIMRDSTIGTYGTLALILSVGLRLVLLSHLIGELGTLYAALVVLSVASLSRCAILQPWSVLPAARSTEQTENRETEKPATGLSALYGSANTKSLQNGIVASLPAVFLLFIATGIWTLLLALILLQLSVLTIISLCKRHIGGHTGDTLGATQQVSELALLLAILWTI